MPALREFASIGSADDMDGDEKGGVPVQSPISMENWSKAAGSVKQRDRSSVEVIPPTPAAWREDVSFFL